MFLLHADSTPPDDEAGGARPLAGAHTLCLGRGLCRYRYAPPPPGGSRREAAATARLLAQAEDAFAESGVLVVRAGPGYGLWSWDAARVRALAGPGFAYDAARVVPETLLQPAGAGARIVAAADGFEAQVWREGALVASQWRRRMFTPAQWTAFLDAAAADDAPEEPPEPLSLPLDPHAHWRRSRLAEPLGWRDAERAGWLAAAIFGIAAAFFAGSAARQDLRRAAMEAELAALEDAAGAGSGASAQAALGLVRAFERINGQGELMIAAVETLRALRSETLEAQEWSFDGARARLELPGPAPAESLRLAAMRLEAEPWLANVAPRAESSGAVVITAELEQAAVPARRAPR